MLQEHYGLDQKDLIKALYDSAATRRTLYDELFRLKGDDHDGKPLISADENLVLVFSGHGYMDQESGRGYWAPFDAPAEMGKGPELEEKMISVEHLVDTLSKVNAHHILLIVDACFSGAFAGMELEVAEQGNWNNPDENPSRWALTAGRNQLVKDKSPFAEALQQVLKENTDLKISIKWIGSEIERRVGKNSEQLPWCGPITRNKTQVGEFHFYRQTPAPNLGIAEWQAISIAELPLRLKHGSRAHLDRLKKGRFQHLRIENLLFSELAMPDFFETKVKTSQDSTPLHQALRQVWQQGKRHAIVLGEGGAGKTVSLMRLWEDMLNLSAVPVFVALNEYNAAPSNEKNDFVLRYIAKECLGIEALTDDWKNAIWQVLQNPLADGSPSALLLLDGFNEITVEKTELLTQLNKIAEKATGVQMVVTSRYVEIKNFTWAQDSETLELLPLETSQIENYFQLKRIPLPENPELLKLFSNPMMLTLYMGSDSIRLSHQGDERFRWLPVASQGELLWNFQEAQLARFLDDTKEGDEQEQAWLTFLLRHLLPYIAFRLEKEGQYFIHTRRGDNDAFNIKSVLEDAYQEWNTESFTDTFTLFEGKRKAVGFGVSKADLDGEQERYVRIRKYLVEKLQLLVVEDETLRFVHQNFRDFLAACHLLNDVDLNRAKVPISWTERTFPVYLRRMIANIEGEHYFDPMKMDKGLPMPGFQPVSRLARLLGRCRGIFHDEQVRYTVWNLVMIIAEGRRTLAGIDLERLDLWKLYLNGIPLSEHLGKYEYLPARLEGSLLEGRKLFVQGHSGQVKSICYSPNGKKILSGASDGMLKEWSVENGECLQIYRGHSSGVYSVCYSPDATRVLSGSADDTLKEWSVESGKCIRTFEGHSLAVINVCYSPDGKKVLSGSEDKTLKEWSVESGECLQTFQGRSHPSNNAIYSPDGKKILSGSYDDTLKEWSVESGRCLQTFQGHSGSVKSICYSPDGKKILSGSYDNTLKEWSVKSGECLQTFQGHSSGIHSVCYSPDGKKVLSSSHGNTVKEWSVESGECLQTFQGTYLGGTNACYSPDGKQVLSGYGNTMKEWSVESGEYLQTFQGYSSGVTSVCYSPDGKKVLSGSYDNTLKEWSIESGKCLQTFQGHLEGITSVSYSPDGKKVLSGSYDNTLKEWSIESGKCLQTFQGHSDFVNSICYSPDGKKVMSGSYDKKLKEWSVENGECLQTFAGDSCTITSVSYSPDGKKILPGSWGKTLKEWSVESKERLQTFAGHLKFVNSACYSPDGKKVLSGSEDKILKEWSVESGECLQTFQGHSETIKSVCYSPDGKKVLSGSEDKTLKEWSVESGECLQTFQGHSETIKSVCYSPDGRKVLSGSEDKALKEWSVEKREFLFIREGHLLEAKVDSKHPRGERILLYDEDKVHKGEALSTLLNISGLSVWQCDLTSLHPDSIITDEEKDLLRQYGAIFSDEDERRWKEAVADAYEDIADE